VDKSKLRNILNGLVDIYGDAYITKNRIRYFIKENFELLFTCLEHGDKIKYNDNAIVIIIGYSDKAPRKYLKILAKTLNDTESLLQDLFREVTEDIYLKIKKNNPVMEVVKKFGFIFLGNRGREILLIRKYKIEK